MEVDPNLAVPDDEARAYLRRKLIALSPDPSCTILVRNDVDLSILQKDIANIQTQLSAAGFQIVSYRSSKPLPAATSLISDKVGKLIDGKGIFMGIWEPHDREGKSIGKKYNVFAAPEDLTTSSAMNIALTFKDAAKELGEKKEWHNHEGLFVSDDIIDSGYEAYLYEILSKEDSYNGEWFIPTRALLYGKNVGGSFIRPKNNLYALKDVGAFINTFAAKDNSFGSPRWYWSCTEPREKSDCVWGVDFTSGDDGGLYKNNQQLSIRPVRAELIL